MYDINISTNNNLNDNNSKDNEFVISQIFHIKNFDKKSNVEENKLNQNFRSSHDATKNELFDDDNINSNEKFFFNTNNKDHDETSMMFKFFVFVQREIMMTKRKKVEKLKIEKSKIIEKLFDNIKYDRYIKYQRKYNEERFCSTCVKE